MKKEEAIKMIKAKLECMTRDVSGIDEDCNMSRCDECDLNYDQGNMGQQLECLKMVIQALEQEPMQVELEGDGYADGHIVYDWGKCPKCGWEFEDGDKDWEEPYCCHCGQKLHWFESEDKE